MSSQNDSFVCSYIQVLRGDRNAQQFSDAARFRNERCFEGLSLS